MQTTNKWLDLGLGHMYVPLEQGDGHFHRPLNFILDNIQNTPFGSWYQIKTNNEILEPFNMI